MNSNRLLAILLAAFFALAIFYSLVIPLFEGPDEDDHFRLVKFIADRRALPVQLFEPGGGAAGHQGWQPPLYYALAALVVAPIDTSDFSERLWRNDAVTFVGDPACCGRNIYYHLDSENFPFTNTTLAVHLARLITIGFGMMTVAATYALSKIISKLAFQELHVSDYHLFPLAVAALVAFNPSFLFASALVSNDVPLAAFSTLVLLLWVRLLCGQAILNSKSAALLGGLIGLGILTKMTALGLVPLSIFAIGIAAWRQRNIRSFVSSTVIMLSTIAFVAAWWFVRNQISYGDPLALRLVTISALFPREGPLTLQELFQISIPQLWRTFWGGPTPADFSGALVAVLAVLTILSAVGVFKFIYEITNTCPCGRRKGYDLRITFLSLAAWLGLILASQVQFIRTTQGADQGRYLFPAISVIALFFFVGLQTIGNWLLVIGSKFRITNYEFVICHLSFVISFFLLALLVPFLYTLPAYARPALFPPDKLSQLSHPLQVNFDNRIELRGYELDARVVKPGESLGVTLYWRALAPIQESYRVFVHLVGPDNKSAGGVDVVPARGAFPTVYWKPGDALRDVVQIPVAADALPGKYSIDVGWYPIGKPGERLSVIGSSDDRAIVDSVKIAPRERQTYAPTFRMNAVFANQIELFGSDARWVANGLQVLLYWRARSMIERDYTVFIHALDASGKIIAQIDREPQNGNYPTSIWEGGEEILDSYLLPLNAESPVKRLAIGLYRADTGDRLAVTYLGKSDDHVEVIFGVGQ